MLEISVPGYDTLRMEHMVFDYNGTLAEDGLLVNGVKERLIKLAESVSIHVVTADTFGKAQSRLDGIPCQFSVIGSSNQDVEKLEYVRSLGYERTVCFGNGRNDRLMIRHALLGIGVVLAEGAARETLAAADIVCYGIVPALDLFLNPNRLIATLRS